MVCLPACLSVYKQVWRASGPHEAASINFTHGGGEVFHG